MSELKKIQPIDIILVTYNRLHFLKKSVKHIYERTRYPHRLFVVDNNSTLDKTQYWLKRAKIHGYIYDYIFMPDNKGLATGFNAGFERVKSEYFITTQDDILCPDLTPCWLEQMLHLAKKYPEYGGLAMRIQRTRHRDVDEFKELVESPTSIASVFRIQKKSDIKKMGGFGDRPHWESTSFMRRMKPLKKKLAVTTRIYTDHIGFMADNKGFAKGFTEYHTYSKERVLQGPLQPYPDIDPKTFVPLKLNSRRDRDEQKRRQAYYDYWGQDTRRTEQLIEDQKMLGPYARYGKGIEIGCGSTKCHPNAIGIDVYPFKTADIVGDARDLWMFKDDELDFVIGSHSLEHFPDTKKVLKEWVRVLKPGGIIAMAVPDGEKRPKSILGSHKVALTREVLRIIFKFELKMKVVRLEDVPGKKKGQECFLIVALKIKD